MGMGPLEISQKYSDFSHSELDKTENTASFFIHFCDKFGLNHTGWANQEGLGLLKNYRLPGNENFQWFLSEERESLFGPEVFAASIFKRMIAATYVTKYLAKPTGAYQRQIKSENFSLLSPLFLHHVLVLSIYLFRFSFILHLKKSIKRKFK
jgi:hypothetical protein